MSNTSKKMKTRNNGVQAYVYIPESMLDKNLSVSDCAALAELVNKELERVRKAARKTFNIGEWIKSTDHRFIINGLVNGLSKAHMRKAGLVTFWLSLEAAGVFTRAEEMEWLKGNDGWLQTQLASSMLRYLADESHYSSDGYMELLSRVNIDGRPSGRFTKRDRVYTLLDMANAVPIGNGDDIIKMCVEDMKTYQAHLEAGIGTLTDKKGNILTEKVAKRLIDTTKAAIKNAGKIGWLETLNKTKVLNVSYVPETWTSIQ